MKIFKCLVWIHLFIFFSGAVWSQQVELEVVSGDTSEFFSLWEEEVEGSYRDSATAYRQLRQALSNLQRQGYLAASFDSLNYHGDRIRAFLHPGDPYRWGRFEVVLPDHKLASSIPAPEGLGAHQVINLEEFNLYRERIITFLENRGYPFASVNMVRRNEAGGDTLNAFLHVETGKKYIIDSIYIKGDDPVNRKYLYPYLGVRPGMVYDESSIREVPVKIENLSFLRQIRDLELEFSQGNRVNVFLYLDRARSNRAEGAVGFLPGESGKVRFTGHVNLDLWNIFRRGEQLGMQWRNPEPKTQELNLNVDVSYLLFQLMGFHGTFEWYRKDTSYMNRSARLGVPFHVKSHSRIEVFGDFEASSVLSGGGLSSLYEDYSSSLWGLRYLYNRLDYPLNPARGMRWDVFLSAGKRKTKGAENSQTSAEAGLDASLYYPLYGSWILHLANQSRYRQVWEEGKTVGIRENGLYRFGGFGSLRGFDDNALQASAYSFFTLEVKYILSRNSNVYAFFDGAWYKKDTPQGQMTDVPYGFGLGGHLDSGMGIFYISYALGRQFGNPIDVGSGRIHLGYVSKF
ncbi:MAG: BamA/TamA family outer membrane protein [Bacteroidales bacterium]|nr:BamA/TamA family outer membrane protein [Bacteroidales bacterium]